MTERRELTRVCTACGIIMVGFVSLGGCKEAKCPQKEEPPVVETVPDAGAEPEGLERNCGNACASLARLGCPEAMPNAGGDSCYVICAKAEASKKFTLKPKCLAAAKSIGEVKACGTVRCTTATSAP